MAKEKEKIYRLLLTLGGIIILILIFFSLGKLPLPKGESESNMPKEQEQQSKTQTAQEEAYPHNLIEGTILEIDHSKPTSFVLDANTSKISTAKTPSMEKTIKLSKKTKLVLFDMTTKKESPLKFSELEVEDPLVIGTDESTYEKVNELDEFVATKISKYVNYPGE